jgi:hypothetical protein
MFRFVTMVVIASAFTGAGCKKKTDDASTSSKTAETAAGPTTPAPAADKAAGSCPAGFTDPGVDACVKLPAGLKPDPTAGVIGGHKHVAFVGGGDGHVTVDLISADYSPAFWDDHVKGLLAGGGFGGKLLEQGKIGDGVWGVFDVDSGQRKYSASYSHGEKRTVECTATHDVGSKATPAIEEMMEICKTIVAH